MEYLVPLLFFGLPALSLIWFVVSLVGYLRTDKSDAQARKAARGAVVTSGICMAVLVGMVTALLVMLSMAVANM